MPDQANCLHPGLDGQSVMGVFCHEVEVAIRLYALGIPVWQICAASQVDNGDAIQAHFMARQPANVIQSVEGMPARRRVAFAGLSQLNAISEMSGQRVDYTKIAYAPGQAMAPDDELLASTTSKTKGNSVKTHSGRQRCSIRRSALPLFTIIRRLSARQGAFRREDTCAPPATGSSLAVGSGSSRLFEAVS